MTEKIQDDLSVKGGNYKSEWALFLPACSSFYVNSMGKNQADPGYFGRTLSQIPNWDQLNYMDEQNGLFFYNHGLYSAGHANLDTTVVDPKESIIRDRASDVFMLGDSGGFQISKGVWPGNWLDKNCPHATKYRQAVLKWMDTYMDYGMCLDIPTATINNKKLHVFDPTKKTGTGIATYADAVAATHINNEYFIQNRTGECKFLNVLQGRSLKESNNWYDEMKKYCDPAQYPDNHFNGWAMGGQNKAEIHTILVRLVHIVHDDFLQEGKHDWIHFLGLSALEWAVMFTDIQQVLREQWNPSLTISFDCASPFMSAAKGLGYVQTSIEDNKKWTYSMEKTAEDKNFTGDTTLFRQAVLQRGIHTRFDDSPITARLTLGDMCPRGHGAVGLHGKETKTSWDTLSYVLLQLHNTHRHLTAVKDANLQYEKGIRPAMLYGGVFDESHLFKNVMNEIFDNTLTKDQALDVVHKYNSLWTNFRGTTGFNTGKKSITAKTYADQLGIPEVPKTKDIVEEVVQPVYKPDLSLFGE